MRIGVFLMKNKKYPVKLKSYKRCISLQTLIIGIVKMLSGLSHAFKTHQPTINNQQKASITNIP